MEPHITADIIYSLVLKLKGEGLSDAEIKKALVNSVLGEHNLTQTLQKEAIFIQKRHKTRFKKRSIIYSVFGSTAIYLVLQPFLSTQAANIAFLGIALGLSTILVIKLHSLYM
jgi:hypothetical protein